MLQSTRDEWVPLAEYSWEDFKGNCLNRLVKCIVQVLNNVEIATLYQKMCTLVLQTVS